VSQTDLTLVLVHVILTNTICRHDLIMAAIYLLAVPTVIVWHHRIWVIYLMACLACVFSALEAAGLF
jgi:hypothetical protein